MEQQRLKISGILNDVKENSVIIGDAVYSYNPNDFNEYELKELIGEEIETVVDINTNYLTSFKAISHKIDINNNLMPQSLLIDKETTAFSEVTLDTRLITEEPQVFTAYCIELTKHSTLRSSYVTARLKDKNNKIITANLFTNNLKEVEAVSNTRVSVAILRSGDYYNLLEIRHLGNILESDPSVKTSEEFILNTIDNIKSEVFTRDNFEQIIRHDLTDEIKIKLAYAINQVKFNQYHTQCNIKLMIEGLLYYVLGETRLDSSVIKDDELNKSDRRLLKAIKLKVFSTELVAMFSENAELYSKEKLMVNSAIEYAELMYSINYEYDRKEVSK